MIWIIVCIALVCAVCVTYIFFSTHKKIIEIRKNLENELTTAKYNYELSIREKVEAAREDALKRSKAVTRGQNFEQIVPIFPDFPYDPSLCKFLGKPIDYIVFKEDEIIFADVKTGKARLNNNQKTLKELINQGKVRFETWSIYENNKIVIK